MSNIGKVLARVFVSDLDAAVPLNGARLIARHPDGAVFEYIETGRGSG